MNIKQSITYNKNLKTLVIGLYDSNVTTTNTSREFVSRLTFHILMLILERKFSALDKRR